MAGKQTTTPSPFETEAGAQEVFDQAVDAEILVIRHQINQALHIDSLTHVANRRYFDRRIKQEVSRAKRHNEKEGEANLSLLMLDIDYFKQVNDRYGHQIGDRVLKKVALILRKNLREEDIVARYGGEEFVAILPETNLNEAKIVAEKLRKIVEEETKNHNGPTLTISIGCAELKQVNGELEGASRLQEAADKALYHSKENGRNRVTVYSEEMKMPAEKKETAEKIIPAEIKKAAQRLLANPQVLNKRIDTIQRQLPADPYEQLAILEQLTDQAKKAAFQKTGTEG